MIRLPKFLTGALAVALLLGFAMPGLAEETKGTVRSVDSFDNKIVLKGLLRDTHYFVKVDANVRIDGREAKIEDIREGDRATINYLKEGDDFRAESVRVLRDARDTSGTIRNMVSDKQQIVLKGLLRDTTYQLDRDGTVWINGKESNFSDLRPEDEVFITYIQRGDDLMVTEIRCTRR